MAQQKTIEIPADYATTAYAPPDGATADELKALADAAQAKALDLLKDDNYTDDELAQARWLAAAIEACQTQATAIETAATERRNAADELRAKIQPAALADDEPNGGTEAEGGDGGDGTQVEQPAEAVVAAAATTPVVPSASAIAKTTKRPDVPAGRGGSATLLAAADVPGFPAGGELTMEQLGEAFDNRSRSMSGLAGTRGTFSHGVARIRVTPADQGLVASGVGGTVDITAALDHAADEKRLPNGSLVAAGGWCAPSEPLYDLLNLISTDGLLDLPEITVSRGGIKFATGPDFNAVFANGGLFTQTEAQAISGTTKASAVIPCPSPTDARMGVAGLFLTSPILQQHGWPEATADFIQKAQAVFQHYLSSLTIADIVSGSTAVDLSQTASGPAALAYGALSTVLGAVALQIEDMKYKGRLSRGQSVEVVLPYFARGIFRSDLMKRQVTDPAEIVLTDAQIDQLFTNIGASVQYVYDWQDHTLDSVNQTGFGGSTAIASWPATFKVLIYPSGTWARAVEPVIDLSALYDSTLLAENEYVGLFTEQGRLTVKRGFDSRIVKVQSNPNGATAGTVTVSDTAVAI